MLLLVICSFHEDMRTFVHVKGMCLDSFTVRNGCTMAPVLFNLYFCDMVADWRRQFPQAEVTFCYCHGHKVIEDHRVASSFVAVAQVWGLIQNLKTWLQPLMSMLVCCLLFQLGMGLLIWWRTSSTLSAEMES